MIETAGGARQLSAFSGLYAYYDPASGLPNQILFMDRLAHALLGASRRGSGVAVLFVEVGISAAVADLPDPTALLRAIGERLEGSLRPNDTIARLAGCQFLAMIEDLSRPTDATFVARRLIEALARPFTCEDGGLGVGATIGVAARVPADLQVQPDELVLEAERALRQAQRSGTSWALISGDVIDAPSTPDSPCAQ